MEKTTKLHELKKSDDELVRAFQNGSTSAFDSLVVKYKDRIFSLCYSFLKDYEESNDCAQEVFIKVYRSLNGFRFKSALSTWLYRVTVNNCKNRLRSKEFKRRKFMVRSDDNPGALTENGPKEFESEEQSPAHVLENKEKLRHVREAIESLPFKLRTIIILRDIQGLAYDEIAKISRIEHGTVKSRISRARAALREKLRDVI